MVELSRRAARKTAQAVTEYLARTGRGPDALDAFRGDALLLGKTTEVITSGTSGDVQVYAADRGISKGDETGRATEDRVYNCYARGHSFEEGEWCIILRMGGTGMEIIPFGAGGGTSTGTDTDETCDCDLCIKGIEFPDANSSTGCCKSLLEWELENPWQSAGGRLILEYIGEDKWLSEPFEGGLNFADTYRWLLTVNTEDVTTLTLTRETDQGDPDICVIYGRKSFNCQCTNSLSILKPYGKWEGIERRDFTCNACLTPLSAFRDFGLGDEDLPPEVVGNNEWCQSNDLVAAQVAHVIINASDDFYSGCQNAGGIHTLVGAATGQTYPTCSSALSVATTCVWQKWGACERQPNLRATTTCTQPNANHSNDAEHFVGVSAGVAPQLGRAEITVTIYAGADVNDSRQFVRYYTDTWDGTSEVITLSKILDGTCGDDDDECCANGEGDPTESGSQYLCTFPGSAKLYLNWSILDAIDPGQPIPDSPDSTGACADVCGSTPTPEDPDNGGCCIRGACLDWFDEALCADFDGDWFADGCGDCENVGACCLNGNCTETTEYDCGLLGGTWSGGGYDACAGNPCDDGACCIAATGGCEQRTLSTCQAPDYWWGTEIDCTDSPCANAGACCHNDNAGAICASNCQCQLLTETECTALDVSGTSNYAGDGTYCDQPGVAEDCDCRGLDCDFA